MKTIFSLLLLVIFSNFLFAKDSELIQNPKIGDKYLQTQFESVAAPIGSSDYIEFYSTQTNDTIWPYLSGFVDDLVVELLSYWERPLFENLLDDQKIKLYLYNRNELATYFGSGLPDWKCGAYKMNEKSVAIVIPESAEQLEFYQSLKQLVQGTVAQLILAIRYHRQWDYNDPPSFFMEGFGLYFSGQRPVKQHIINWYNNQGRYPEMNDLEDVQLANYTDQYYKDLITSYIQYVKLADRSYHYMFPYEDVPEWQAHWKHFYLNPEDELIKLYASSENFDIYCMAQDAGDAALYAAKCEEKLADYKQFFEVEFPHRVDVVVYPNTDVGTECWGKPHPGGHGVGSDKFDFISPRTIWGGPEDPDHPIEGALDFMIPHEFLHVYHNMFWPFYTIMGQFYIEGLANFMAGYGDEGYLEIDGDDYNLWKIDAAFANCRFNQKREPTLEDLSDHTVNDAYYFGEHYFNFLIKSGITFTQIRDWFITNKDWSVYPVSYETIDTGYVNYLKRYAHLVPQTNPRSLPFTDEFNDFSKGWGRFNKTSLDNWLIDDAGTDNLIARVYNYTEDIDTNQVWLISPMLDASGLEQVYISFDAAFNEDIVLEVFYTETYDDPLNEADWIPIDGFRLTNFLDWRNTGEIEFKNPPEHFHIGIRYSSSGEMHHSGGIDNFRVSAERQPIETVNLPFFDDFSSDYKNWTHFSNKGEENWHLSGDDGIDGGKCARFYITTNPVQENDDWLITKRFNSSEYSKLSVSFKYWYHGNGIMPEIWYSSDFLNDFESANWTKVDYEDWGVEWTWNAASFNIQAPDDNITFAIHYQSEESKSIYYLMDNFRIEGTITSAKSINNIVNNLLIYPNPITTESIISFQTKTSGNVKLSIYDLQGRKICTLLEEKLNAGKHTIPVSNTLPVNGIYCCKLATSEGVLTLNLIVNSK